MSDFECLAITQHLGNLRYSGTARTHTFPCPGSIAGRQPPMRPCHTSSSDNLTRDTEPHVPCLAQLCLLQTQSLLRTNSTKEKTFWRDELSPRSTNLSNTIKLPKKQSYDYREQRTRGRRKGASLRRRTR